MRSKEELSHIKCALFREQEQIYAVNHMLRKKAILLQLGDNHLSVVIVPCELTAVSDCSKSCRGV